MKIVKYLICILLLVGNVLMLNTLLYTPSINIDDVQNIETLEIGRRIRFDKISYKGNILYLEYYYDSYPNSYKFDNDSVELIIKVKIQNDDRKQTLIKEEVVEFNTKIKSGSIEIYVPLEEIQGDILMICISDHVITDDYNITFQEIE